MQTIAALYNTPEQAGGALRELYAHGISPEQVSLIGSPTAARDMARTTDATLAAGPVGGAGGGALLGGAAGGLAGLVALAIPGIGPVLAAGPLAAVLSAAAGAAATGAGIGAVAGGLLGALGGQGFAVDTVRAYEERVAQGDILLVVTAPDEQAEQVAATLKQFGAANISAASAD